MADSNLNDRNRTAALKNLNELIAQRARHPARSVTVTKQQSEAVPKDSPVDLPTPAPSEDQEQEHRPVQNPGINVIADTYAQEMVRNGEVPMFNPQPNEEYFAHNIQRNGLRDGTTPTGDWIAYGATLWIVMEQYENIDGQPVHLAGFQGIFTS